MKNRTRWLPFLLSSALLFSFVGCSDDKETTKTYTDGDESSEEFQALESGADGALDLTGDMLFGAIVIADMILDDSTNPNAGKIRLAPSYSLADSVPVIAFTKDYREGTGDWFVTLTIQLADETDTLALHYADSMKFFHGNTPVQWPDSAALTGIQNGMALEVEVVSGGVGKANHGGIFAGHSWTIAGDSGALASGGDIAVQGTGFCDIEFEFEISGGHGLAQDANHMQCSGLFDFGLGINGLAVNLTVLENDGCPTSGSINYSGEVEVACFADSAALEVTGDHTVDVQFSGDSTVFVIRSGDTEWRASEACSQDVRRNTVGRWEQITDRLLASQRK